MLALNRISRDHRCLTIRCDRRSEREELASPLQHLPSERQARVHKGVKVVLSLLRSTVTPRGHGGSIPAATTQRTDQWDRSQMPAMRSGAAA